MVPALFLNCNDKVAEGGAAWRTHVSVLPTVKYLSISTVAIERGMCCKWIPSLPPEDASCCFCRLLPRWTLCLWLVASGQCKRWWNA